MTITGKTKVIALFGNPVSHSLSPQMHNAWIADHGLDAVYVALALAERDPEGALRALRDIDVLGANVTVPFKEAAARAASFHTSEVILLGVANTLSRGSTGLSASNTDSDGFLAALDESQPEWRHEIQNALIVGAGGAARAVLWALAKAEVPSIRIINRTEERARETAALLPNIPWSGMDALAEEISRADLVINTSTLGMKGKADLDWPLQCAKTAAIVVDIVYAPLETNLLKSARVRGLRTVDGLGMLIHQGALAFETWFDIRPDTKKARERLVRIIAERESA